MVTYHVCVRSSFTAQVNTTSYLEKSATVNLSICKLKACFNKNIKKINLNLSIVNFII